MGHVFVSYSSKDREFVHSLMMRLIAIGIDVWFDKYEILAGENWSDAITNALNNAEAMLVIFSKNYVSSEYTQAELLYAHENDIKIVPVIYGELEKSELKYLFRLNQYYSIKSDDDNLIEQIINALPPETIASPNTTDIDGITESKIQVAKNKGYIFISYSIEDIEFTIKLRKFFAEKGYAYWDYQESHRKYDMPFHLELEGAITDAKAVVSVVSPDWKSSKWATREYLFSEQLNKTNFVCIVRDVGATLLYADKTFIEFFDDEERGFSILDKALLREGLLD